ncbi:MAG: YIP1 family protein [Anaerolineae bacterium]|uniref:Yip1 family protein n=1 Tax=Promineifilum sp. TaxID=2664178 RepID=UPI001DBB165E|nr:YIP1 family protein [Anaerolineales bacterium]MCO5178713.1 YIP1 family protein [Promineifilum sp.]MCW5846942.1 YIP1 family protein [Anaerolineae bacterium]
MLQRILGVFKLDKATFAEIEADQTATTQAALVVILVAVVAGIGAALAATMLNRTLPGVMEGLGDSLGEGFDMSLVPQLSPVGAFLNALIGALLSWLVWSALTYFIGTKVFNATADMGEMLRVIGFAQAPRLLSGLGFIPCLGGILGFVGLIWALVASFVGIREGLDLDTGKTLATIVIAFIGAWLISFLVGLVMAPLFAIAS